jgi:putative NADH-flavin reductase
MNLTVLAASGRTGIALTRQALRRGHTVTAIARDPEKIALPDSPNLRKLAGDVNDAGSIAAAWTGIPWSFPRSARTGPGFS